MAKFDFINDDDVKLRILNSVVTYNKEPVLVCRASKDLCDVIKILSGDLLTVKTEELDLTPVSVGNVQLSKKFIYCQRMPVRKWKQGLSPDNLIVKEMPWDIKVRADVLLSCKEFGQSLFGTFSSLEDGIKQVVEDKTHVSVAFSQRWGIGNVKGITYLFYKGLEVGVYDDCGITLFGKYAYLKEDLLSIINKK